MRIFPRKFVLLGVTMRYIDNNNVAQATQFCTYWLLKSELECDFTELILSVHKPNYPIPENWRPVIESVTVLITKWRWA